LLQDLEVETRHLYGGGHYCRIPKCDQHLITTTTTPCGAPLRKGSGRCITNLSH